MVTHPTHVRVNIYLDEPSLKREIKIAAADQGVTVSAYCVEAIRQKLQKKESRQSPTSTRSELEAAKSMDRLREEIGPVGIPVRDLIDEGRKG